MPDEQFPPPEGTQPQPPQFAPPGGAQPPPPQFPVPGAPGWTAPPGTSWPGSAGSSWQLPGYPPGQPPPLRNRSRRVAWLVGSAAVVVAALIAGSIGYVIGDEHSRITSAALGGEAGGSGCQNAPDPAATSPAGAALAARLLPMPSGASPVNLLKQGELSLDDYMQELYGANPNEKQRLTALCFQAAAFREWSLPSGSTAAIWLIQFAGNDGARSYILGTEQADSSTAGNTVKFTVPGVGDGTAIADPTLDKDGNTLAHLLGDNGDVAMLIHVYTPAHLDDAFATQVLQQQNRRL